MEIFLFILVVCIACSIQINMIYNKYKDTVRYRKIKFAKNQSIEMFNKNVEAIEITNYIIKNINSFEISLLNPKTFYLVKNNFWFYIELENKSYYAGIVNEFLKIDGFGIKIYKDKISLNNFHIPKVHPLYEQLEKHVDSIQYSISIKRKNSIKELLESE